MSTATPSFLRLDRRDLLPLLRALSSDRLLQAFIRGRGFGQPVQQAVSNEANGTSVSGLTLVFGMNGHKVQCHQRVLATLDFGAHKCPKNVAKHVKDLLRLLTPGGAVSGSVDFEAQRERRYFVHVGVLSDSEVSA